jgi:hypothetical protein
VGNRNAISVAEAIRRSIAVVRESGKHSREHSTLRHHPEWTLCRRHPDVCEVILKRHQKEAAQISAENCDTARRPAGHKGKMRVSRTLGDKTATIPFTP